MKKLGFCITGSFCSMKDMLSVLSLLVKDYDVEVFMTPNVQSFDTRFQSAKNLKEDVEALTKKPVLNTIQDAEVYGPMKSLDIVLVYPCDGNTLAKVNSGINDNVVTMIIKSSLRNQVPIVFGVFSNDILGASGKNLLTLFNKKNLYFVPMIQDDFKNKPNSAVACHTKVQDTLEYALLGKQLHPFLLGYKEV